jgi:hypothetical protein
MPTIAPVEREGEGLEEAVGVVLTVADDVAVVTVATGRVAVRTAMFALRVKYTGRSRLDQVAGAVTVALPKELGTINMTMVKRLGKMTYLPPTLAMISSGTT